MTGAGAGSDFLQLDRAAAPRGGLTDWLTEQLRAAITDRRLQPGALLPPTRLLAGDLGVSRGAVIDAYTRLAEEGLVDARPGVGTRVLPTGSSGRTAARVEHPSGRPAAAGSPPGRLPLPRDPDIRFDLSPGVPDLSAFPRAAWLRAERAVLTSVSHADLGYGDVRGHPRLRAELAGWLARTRGVRAAPDEILVVAGVAQSLALLACVLSARGITEVAVEDPGSRGARDQLTAWGLTCTPVEVDGDGLRIDQLQQTAARVAVLTPAHQFPTGVLLAPSRRRQLVAWARDEGLVIEDDYDAEHRYDRLPTPAVHASAPDRVVHTGSTSKTLAPGMRLGWLIPPAHLRADLIAARHATDLGSPALPQLVLAELIATGALERHLRRARIRQRTRRDALLAGLRRHLPDARVQGIAAGLHLTVLLPDLAFDDTDLADRLRDSGVVAHPLSWHRQRPGPPGLVLGYAAHPPDQLSAAAALIGAAIRI